MPTTVIGLFDDVRDAQQVIETLEGRGFNRGDISIVARSVPATDADIPADEVTAADIDESRVNEDGVEPASPAASGAGTGAILGGTAGLFLGLAALAIPGIGPFLAVGPLAAALAGAGIGAATGGIVGGLTNAGVPEESAPYYAEAVQRGATLVAVTTDEPIVPEIEALMEMYHAVRIEERVEQWRNEGWEDPITNR